MTMPSDTVVGPHLDGEARNLLCPPPTVSRDRVPVAEQECTMNAIGRHRVSSCECPSREYRADDLKTMSNPIDTFDQFVLVHVRSGRACEVEHDFGLDAGLGKSRQRERP